MSEKYTGRAQDRRYSGSEVDITYNVKRCIHAEYCVHPLSKELYPWKLKIWK